MSGTAERGTGRTRNDEDAQRRPWIVPTVDPACTSAIEFVHISSPNGGALAQTGVGSTWGTAIKNQKQTIRKIVSFLNEPDEEGGFWLPNIQRPFVWNEEQICRLFDSILREYPISTMLIWKTKSTIRRRKFIDNWKPSLHLTDFFVPENTKKKCLVLDGQQRLQSLFIALYGSYEGKELFFDVLSGEVAAPDDIKYRFGFLSAEKAKFPWTKFKDLVLTTKKDHQLADDIAATADRQLERAELDKVRLHMELITRTFKTEEVVSYQELDSIDNPELYQEDDVVEIFIRANSGGTKLGKSDLLFSLLTSTWDEADQGMEDLLGDLNQHGFLFTQDFVLKTCLSLLEQGARYEVDKFRKPGVREQIQEKWGEISKAIRDVLDFVRGRTFIRGDKAIPSYLALIPLVYSRYHFAEAWKKAKEVDGWLVRTLLAGAFSGTPDQMIDECTKAIKEAQGFDAKVLFGTIRSRGRSLELSEERFWSMGYGSDSIHLLFHLWYREFNYTPAYAGNMPQVDHVFPQSLLRKVKVEHPETGKRSLMRYRDAERNQLANCMLLTQEENGAGGKSDIPPGEWFANKPQEYLALHLIPEDPELWNLDRFDDFARARKALIREKFRGLLVREVVDSNVGDGIQRLV